MKPASRSGSAPARATTRDVRAVETPAWPAKLDDELRSCLTSGLGEITFDARDIALEGKVAYPMRIIPARPGAP
jgi:hypothetical protein